MSNFSKQRKKAQWNCAFSCHRFHTGKDLNPRPDDYESSALPTELPVLPRGVLELYQIVALFARPFAVFKRFCKIHACRPLSPRQNSMGLSDVPERIYSRR